MKQAIRVFTWMFGATIVFYGVDFALNAIRMRLIPKNFSTVVPNRLYRSGQLRPEHFEQVVRQHGIKTLVALNPHDDLEEANRAKQLGLRYHSFLMPGSGQGKPEMFHEFLRIAGDQENGPLLVHCAAGAYRTGVAVALYRMTYQNWTFDDALREMTYSGCPVLNDQPLRDHIQMTFASRPKDLR